MWLISLLLFVFLALPISAHSVPQRLFAATEAGPFVSYSWGEHWQRLREIRGLMGKINTFICMEPNVFAGGVQGLFLSDDLGENYRSVGSWNGGEITALLAAKFYPADLTIFAGTSKGLYRSMDGGGEWNQIGGGVLLGYVRELSWPGPYLFAAADTGFYSSEDGGDQWEQIRGGLPDAPIVTVTVSRFFSIDPVVFVGSKGQGVYRSRDGGKSFEKVGGAEWNDRIVHVLFWWRSILLAGTENGLFLSNDMGESWESPEVLRGFPSLSLLIPAAEAGVNSDIIVGTPRGVYKSSDGGQSFRHVVEGMGAIAVTGFATFPVPDSSKLKLKP